MNPSLIRDAQQTLDKLPAGDRATVKALPGQLRSMGLVATLEWLSEKKDGKALEEALRKQLEKALREHLDEAARKQLGPLTRAALTEQLSSVVFLEAMRHAAAFADALHLVNRALDKEQG